MPVGRRVDAPGACASGAAQLLPWPFQVLGAPSATPAQSGSLDEVQSAEHNRDCEREPSCSSRRACKLCEKPCQAAWASGAPAAA